MLKRYQIILEDWLNEYIRFLAEEYDFSYSEVIRIGLSLEFIDTIVRLYPNYRPDITKADIAKLLNRLVVDKISKEEAHRLLSKIYFEARKAIEYRMEKTKKRRVRIGD